MRFSGQVALVTGAASGIGRAVALRLAQDGADIVVADLNSSQAATVASKVERLGRQALPLTVDVSSRSSAQAMVDAALQRFSHVDALVTAAGVLGPHKPSWEWTEAEAAKVLNVNLLGVHYCCQAMVPSMRQQRRGSIVAISSTAGKDGLPNGLIYAASKGAVLALVKSLAREVAADGIRVNCVSPAIIDTPMAALLGNEYRKAAVARLPIGRIGEAPEVAAVIAFLCSADASFVTGQCYDVSGGRSVY